MKDLKNRIKRRMLHTSFLLAGIILAGCSSKFDPNKHGEMLGRSIYSKSQHEIVLRSDAPPELYMLFDSKNDTIPLLHNYNNQFFVYNRSRGRYEPNITLADIAVPFDGYLGIDANRLSNHGNPEYRYLVGKIMSSEEMSRFLSGINPYSTKENVVSINQDRIKINFYEMHVPIRDLSGVSLDKALVDYTKRAHRIAKDLCYETNIDAWTSRDFNMAAKRDNDVDGYVVFPNRYDGRNVDCIVGAINVIGM